MHAPATLTSSQINDVTNYRVMLMVNFRESDLKIYIYIIIEFANLNIDLKNNYLFVKNV